MCYYLGTQTARLNGVIVAHPLLEVRILSSMEEVLVSSVVGELIQDPVPALHTDGVAASEV